MQELHDLEVLLKSRYPILLIETHEEQRVVGLLQKVAFKQPLPLFVWSLADGLRRADLEEPVYDTKTLTGALRHVDSVRKPGLYAFLDAHPFLEDPLNQRLIKEISQDDAKWQRPLVFIGPQATLPPDLRRMAAQFEPALTTPDDIKRLLQDEAREWKRQWKTGVKGDNDIARLLMQHLAGLPKDDARRLVRQAVQDDGVLCQGDISRILRFKHDALESTGVLTLELDTGRFEDVAGQANLKRWLALRKAAFTDAGDGSLDAPRGVLLLGVQGAGKSLAAKAIAGHWGLPLLRFDFGALYNKFHGETERNLRESLKAADAMAPCVLWIDEIEKGISPDDGADGGTSKRVLGSLLTWMSERQSRVFLAATANDVSRLPPELLRKGRFDEIFFVDLPDAETREAIFRIHLAARGQDVEAFDCASLAGAADGFSGAEIEQGVVSAVYEARATGAPLTQADLERAIAGTRPLSVLMAEKIASLRDWAASRTVSAG